MLGFHVADALPELRVQAESLMVDVGSLERRTGHTTDPTTGARVDVWTSYWAGPMRIRTALQGQQVAAGGQERTVSRPQLQLPVLAPAPRKGDRVVLSTGDPAIVGVPLFIQHVQIGTHLVMRRCDVTFDQG